MNRTTEHGPTTFENNSGMPMLQRLPTALATTGLFTLTLLYNVDDPGWPYWAMLIGWFAFALCFGAGNSSSDAGGSSGGDGGAC